MKSEKIPTEEASLEEALSPLVTRLIDKNYESSKDKISMQIAPLIGGAIRKQIQSQKDDIVDALYPVMGNMISRYFTKMFEEMLVNINKQIQSGLSVKTLKRKLTAKFKGISETELLLSENTTATIRALLLIHKETGIVIAHEENPNYPLNEPEMLASMITAIRSFVNEWVEKNGDNNELAEIEYGDKKIIIESSGYSYLAIIIQGNANKMIYDKIRATLETIVLNHGEDIKKFNGNLEAFSKLSLHNMIFDTTNYDQVNEEKTSKLHPLIFVIPILFIAYLVYYFYTDHLNEELTQQVNTKLYKTPALTLFRLTSNVNNGLVTLSGEVPFDYHKQLAQTTLNGIQGIKGIKNEIVVVNTLQDPMQISSNIAYLLKGFNTQKGVNVTYTFDYDTLTLSGSIWRESLKQKILEQIQKINFIHKINDKIEIIPPQIYTTIYFDRGSTKLNIASQTKLITLLNNLKGIDNSYKLILTSYSDQIGSIKRNRYFSKQRLASISNFLKKQGQVQNKLITIIKDIPPKGVDPVVSPEKSRIVIITLANKENNVSL